MVPKVLPEIETLKAKLERGAWSASLSEPSPTEDIIVPPRPKAENSLGRGRVQLRKNIVTWKSQHTYIKT